MNTLSFLIYFASVSDNLKDLFAAFAFLSTLATCGLIVVHLVHSGESVSKWNDEAEKGWFRDMASLYAKWAKRMAALFVFFLLSAVLLPSETTLYAIAGSELGEQIITTPENQDILRDLRTLIEQKIEGAING